MILRVERFARQKGYTIGRMYINGAFLCNTLEDQDRGLDQKMPVGTILSKKVFGRTAIPKGRYVVVMSHSPKFEERAWAQKYSGLVPEVLNVKGFEGIRIHPSNDPREIQGCLAPGDNTAKGKVTGSTARYYELMTKFLMSAWVRGETIFLDIV